ncbi:MAG: 23S rRNA (guanosine(2251)-2'-O)-methyltransferase RlmB [Bacilli bacterium]|nr:23S rRNA (guanosine(2251)-2'-O)-methyltransferase RlmB [Bacilli bacterium]
MTKEISENIIYGRNPVKEALKADRVKKIFLKEGFSDKEVLGLINKQNIEIKSVHIHELDNMCDGVHQGIAAFIKPYFYVSVDEIIQKSKKVEKPIIVILDGINDPHNMGAILRACDVFNVSGLIISKHNQVPLNATVAKTSAGAINYIPVAACTNLNQTIKELKDNGFWIVSSDGIGEKSYLDLKYDFPTVLVIGSEGFGVSQLLLKNSDFVVKIPQYGHVNSLNASVAAGILLAKIRG